MAKLKTPKAISKRFTVTKNNKVLHRKGGQDHFNSRDSGKVTRNKRRDKSLSETHARFVRSVIS